MKGWKLSACTSHKHEPNTLSLSEEATPTSSWTLWTPLQWWLRTLLLALASTKSLATTVTFLQSLTMEPPWRMDRNTGPFADSVRRNLQLNMWLKCYINGPTTWGPALLQRRGFSSQKRALLGLLFCPKLYLLLVSNLIINIYFMKMNSNIHNILFLTHFSPKFAFNGGWNY